MKQKSILKKYTLEELVKILDEECNDLGVQCEKNGKCTEFQKLVLPSFENLYSDINK